MKMKAGSLADPVNIAAKLGIAPIAAAVSAPTATYQRYLRLSDVPPAGAQPDSAVLFGIDPRQQIQVEQPTVWRTDGFPGPARVRSTPTPTLTRRPG